MKIKWFLLFVLITTTLLSQNRRFERYLKELKDEFKIVQIQPDSLEFVNPLLLDIREKEEFEISHIKNAVFSGYYDFSVDQLESVSKDTTIVVYCSVGFRSSKVAQKLIEAGFKDVRNLYGGIFKWINQERVIIKESTPTDSIHTYNKRWGRYITNKNIIKIP
jgi:rhodanese-related sulfurtransferase